MVVFEGKGGVSQEESAAQRMGFVIGEPEQMFEEADGLDRVALFKETRKKAPGVAGLDRAMTATIACRMLALGIFEQLKQTNLCQDRVKLKRVPNRLRLRVRFGKCNRRTCRRDFRPGLR